MKKPTKFKSGFFMWKVVWAKEKAEEMFGKTCVVNKIITIYSHENQEILRETLFHELLHVVGEDKYESIFNFEPEKKDCDKEENLIRLLSPALMQVLCDNKDLARYLFKI